VASCISPADIACISVPIWTSIWVPICVPNWVADLGADHHL
jgi:hypothetical protein